MPLTHKVMRFGQASHIFFRNCKLLLYNTWFESNWIVNCLVERAVYASFLTQSEWTGIAHVIIWQCSRRGLSVGEMHQHTYTLNCWKAWLNCHSLDKHLQYISNGEKKKNSTYIQTANVTSLKGHLTFRLISKCSQNKPTSNKMNFYETTAHKDLRSCVT